MLVARATAIAGSEAGPNLTFATPSAGSPTDVLGGRTTELTSKNYQYVTLIGITLRYHNVSPLKLYDRQYRDKNDRGKSSWLDHTHSNVGHVRGTHKNAKTSQT